MKITFINSPLNLTGGNRVVAIYADELAGRGHDVTVVVPRHKKLGLKDQIKVKAGKRKQLFDDVDASHFKGSRAHIKVLDHSGPVTAEDVPDADMVIATWWETAFMVAHYPPSKGEKFYFIQHHEVHKNLPWHLSGGSYYLPLKKITISSWLIDTMRDVYGDSDVALIHNSVDPKQFFTPERGRQKRPTVGLLYSRTYWKGVDISLKAIEIAKRTHPDLHVVAFGTRAPNKDLDLPEGSTFFLSPDQHKIRDIYAMCDVWLCGSRAEGFHLPPSEAMACRCPVVSTRVGGPIDIIEPGVNGYLADIEDSEALGARLSDVLSMDDAAWRKMSDAALACTQSYTWQDATTLFEAAIGAQSAPKSA